MHERLAELRELQDDITARRRDALIGTTTSRCSSTSRVSARSVREAPEIDGVVDVPHDLAVGAFVDVDIVDALGPDLVAQHGAIAGGRIGLMAVEPNALATWANAITTLRLLLAPLMFWMIPDTGRGAWPAAVLWFVLCGSDFVDGYLARKHGTTRSVRSSTRWPTRCSCSGRCSPSSPPISSGSCRC